MVDKPTLTLSEGISEFHRANRILFSERDSSPEAKEFFRCHDTAHVVFGCDTTIFGEGVVKLWTIYGTTLGFWGHVDGYAEADAFSLFKKYTWNHIRKSSSGLFVAIPKVIYRAKNMTQNWPWSDHEEYLEKTLQEIRCKFNIKIVTNT